jgi:hypothetical protein
MKNIRRPLVAASMVAVVAMLASATITSAADMYMESGGDRVAVYAKSYISAGANATITVDAVAGLYLTTGASSTVTGGVTAGGATTLGALATAASICSAGATTLGAIAHGGDIYSGGATTIGAGANLSINGQQVTPGVVESVGAFTGPASQIPADSTSTPILDVCVPEPSTAGSHFTHTLSTSKANAGALPATTGPGYAALPGSISADVTYGPGVHKANGMLTIASGVTITLDGGDDAAAAEFVFNIDSYLAVGAGVNVVVTNALSATVTWNVGGYATIGAGAKVSGNIMTNAYITMGVESAVTGSRTAVIDANGATTGYTCDKGGAVYSLTSYVGIGAGATVGSTGPVAGSVDEC